MCLTGIQHGAFCGGGREKVDCGRLAAEGEGEVGGVEKEGGEVGGVGG